MQKDVSTYQTFTFLFFLILAVLITFFLGVSYPTTPFIEKVIISVGALLFLFRFYEKSAYQFMITLFTGIGVFIAVEISFAINIWLVFLISILSTFTLITIYKKLNPKDHYACTLLILFIIIWIILGFNVIHRQDWILENLLTVPFVILIYFMHKKFQLSNISYTTIFTFMALHIIGSHYTYSEVPFGFWLQDFLGLARNHYDRIVHFSFGLLFAYPIREIAIRIANLKGAWAYYLPIDLVLALSAVYEIIEWWIAVIFGGDLGVVYLGTQGDVWDAQKDMTLAGTGSFITMLITALIVIHFSSRQFFQNIKKSFAIKSKEVLGERALETLIKRKKR